MLNGVGPRICSTSIENFMANRLGASPPQDDKLEALCQIQMHFACGDSESISRYGCVFKHFFFMFNACRLKLHMALKNEIFAAAGTRCNFGGTAPTPNVFLISSQFDLDGLFS